MTTLLADDIAFEDLPTQVQERLTEANQVSKGDTVRIIGESGEHHGLAMGTEALIIKRYESRYLGKKYKPGYLGDAWEIVTNETGDTYWVYEASIVKVYGRKLNVDLSF